MDYDQGQHQKQKLQGHRYNENCVKNSLPIKTKIHMKVQQAEWDG